MVDYSIENIDGGSRIKYDLEIDPEEVRKYLEDEGFEVVDQTSPEDFMISYKEIDIYLSGSGADIHLPVEDPGEYVAEGVAKILEGEEVPIDFDSLSGEEFPDYDPELDVEMLDEGEYSREGVPTRNSPKN